MKTVGILGGMGPAATVDLMRRVIDLTPASDDKDHIRMLVDNNPQVPSRIKAILEGSGEDPGAVLADMAANLEHQGAEFLAMPCNTAHYYLDFVNAAVRIPVLNMLELAADHIQQQNQSIDRVGLLASSALQEILLYEPYFARHDIHVLYPATALQNRLMALIRTIKADVANSSKSKALDAAAADLAKNGADCLLIACTELSVVSSSLNNVLPVYDAAEILALAIVREAMK
ncbi:MAG: amino acid racemase [Xanthomonadales bacterium]|nr:amino acid racemase [Xanthomonadales bacterium]